MSVKIAIVGSGFGMYCLLPAFSKIKECTVVSICGKNSERMENYCEKYGLNRYTGWKEMLQKEKPDAVVIAVIPKHQYEIAKYALENRISVFAEKPLSMNFNTSLELNKLAKKSKLPNMVDFIFPEIFEWCEAKKLIENSVIGKIFNINVDWTFLSYDLKNNIKSWKTDPTQGGGALSLVVSHTFYYLEYFLGKIKSMECNFSSSEKSLNKGETCIDITMQFEDGCNGNAHIDISNEEKSKHIIEFYGENGIMKLENLSDDVVDNFQLKIDIKNKKQKIVCCKLKNTLDDEDPRVKVIKPIAKRFIKWCNSGVPSKPSFQEGLRVQELIEMARNSNSK